MNETRQNSYCQNKNKRKEVKYKKHVVFNLQKGGVRKRAERERDRERRLILCRENYLFIIRHAPHE